MAVLSIVLLLLNSNVLGTEGLGTIGIIVLEITIYLLISNVICGGSLIYYSSRKKVNELMIAAYLWILLSAGAYYLIISLVPVLSSDYLNSIVLLGFLQSVITANLSLLAGQQRFKVFNLVALSQAIIQISSLCIFFFLLDERSIASFIQSTLIAYSFAVVFSFIRLIPTIEKEIKLPTLALFKELIHYGFYLQIANVTQLMNYRLNYFLLDYFSGRASVGQFMAGVQLSEGLLLPSKSIGTVQYAKISSQKSKTKAARLTVTLLKVTLLLTIPITVLLILLPEVVYTTLLSADFNRTPEVISVMGIGIIALAGEIILSRYFSGTGQQKINAVSSTVGLAVTVIAGFTLIPIYGLLGAAACASLSYLSIFIFLLIKIIRGTSLKLSDFILKKQDVVYFKRVLRKVRKS
ncbi:MAG: O-antigen/teichoic acid export membrane protein [Vicingaceae bacterium]